MKLASFLLPGHLAAREGETFPPSYCLAHYNLYDGGKELRFKVGLNEPLFWTAIERGELKGETHKNWLGVRTLKVSTSPEELREFFEKHGKECFMRAFRIAQRLPVPPRTPQ